MRRARFQLLGSLVILLARLTLNKPLPEWEEEDDPLMQDEAEEILSSLTGSMKEHLKESPNVTGVLHPEKTSTKLPQYMIDLYNRYADDRTSMPVSNIIRSFNVEDILSSSSQENLLQSDRLMFNVSIPGHEEVTKAELKLMLSLGDAGRGHLSLFDVLHLELSENLRDSNSFLASQDVAGDESVTIEVTKAVRRWIGSKEPLNGLDVFLKMKAPLDPRKIALDSDRLPPILIVFSDDQRENNVKATPMDLTQVMVYEPSSHLGISSNNTTLGGGKTRARRGAERNHCTKTSLIVNFKDIGWDSIIIFPPSYDAGQCVGNCYYPLTDNLTPTKHAIVQSLMHLKKPKDAGNACCVPTKLEGLHVVYRENKQTIIKKNYEDMKVVECGCR